jgi:copper(I)-binding protein
MTTLLTSTEAEPPAPTERSGFRITRRGLQVALGLVWLLDGALQLQPFMFGSGFASDVLAPAGNGQPGWVSAGVHWAATLVGGSPAVWNSLFAAIQLALGVGLLIRPLVRFALIGSIAWGLGVWYLGEGAGGLAGGHASLLTGAPGAVLLYVVLAAVVWPVPGPSGRRGWTRQDESAPPAPWTPMVWAVVWIGGAVLQALPGQNTAGAVADSLTGAAMPSWLMPLVTSVADGFTKLGGVAVWLLLAVLVGIGLGALGGRRLRLVAAWTGIVLSVLFWVFGQGLGNLGSGQSTDPNSGPLLVLLAVALIGAVPDFVAVPADWRRSALVSVAAVAVVGVGLLMWVTTRPTAAGPPPSLAMSAVFTPAGDGASAPVYLTITNNGAGADTLTSASAEFQTGAAAKGVTVCANASCGSDDTVTIAPHSTTVFGPNGPHVLVRGLGMLMIGHQPLQLTLTFARSGVVHVLSPIGSPANLTENDIMTYGFMGGPNPGMGMTGMPGMSGSPSTMPSMPGMTGSGG